MKILSVFVDTVNFNADFILEVISFASKQYSLLVVVWKLISQIYYMVWLGMFLHVGHDILGWPISGAPPQKNCLINQKKFFDPFSKFFLFEIKYTLT